MLDLIGKLEDYSLAFPKRYREDFLWHCFLPSCEAKIAGKWTSTQLSNYIYMAKELIRIIQSLIEMLPLIRALCAKENPAPDFNIPGLKHHLQHLDDFLDCYSAESLEEELLIVLEACKEECGGGSYDIGIIDYNARQFIRMARSIFDLEERLPELKKMAAEAGGNREAFNQIPEGAAGDSNNA